MSYLLKEGFTETQSLHLSLFFLIQHIKAINILQINTRPPARLLTINQICPDRLILSRRSGPALVSLSSPSHNLPPGE